MRLVAVILIASAPLTALADEFSQPKYSPGDSWVYHQNFQQGTVSKEDDVEYSIARLDGDDLLVAIKVVGSTQPPRQRVFHADWSQFRGVNGVETIVVRPLAFPLALGKSWKVDYSEMNPSPGRLREQREDPWRVMGWDEVTTSAGKFKALKIESKGTWVADLQANVRMNSATGAGNGVVAQSQQNVLQGARRVQGRDYHAIWYVPEVKRWVKSLDETYSSSGEVSEHVDLELTAYHLEPVAPATPSPTPTRP